MGLAPMTNFFILARGLRVLQAGGFSVPQTASDFASREGRDLSLGTLHATLP